MLLTACSSVVADTANNNEKPISTQQPAVDSVDNGNGNALTAPTQSFDYTPKGDYNEGTVLVKCDGEFSNGLLSELKYDSVEELYVGSKWRKITLATDTTSVEAVKYLHDLDIFERVDYDYVMQSDATETKVDISGNSYAPNPEYLNTLGVHDAWSHSLSCDMPAGGGRDVVVAVIDTGVDYNHVDLRENIWTNSAEIPDNGIDDDGNGYIDDVYGWDFVGNDKDPIDDNGHGTHVAGTIAADNNLFGTVGVAYNSRIMVLKAGTSSGYFNNSDIAEAIQYAYMNGASVINMSFGGSAISMAVEDALMSAYNACILVAAAGNDNLCNNLACSEHLPKGQVGVSYPAALPYVIGVMSCGPLGLARSGFSNFDHFPGDSVEYEVYAPGESMPSTWPGNKYAMLNGTSMAAPTVSGIAALLRGFYSDREVYSSKFIQSQIVNTGTRLWTHNVANAFLALTTLPKPNVSLYEQYVFDDVAFSDQNNGDGRIDAGETIRIGIELMNKGGVASNVTATIDAIRNGDASLVDPYFEITKGSVTLSDIGTYSVRDGGLIYDDKGLVIGAQEYFEIVVSPDCPNDYLCTFNVNMSYTNGLDEKDTSTYKSKGEFDLTVTNGVVLQSSYTQDTVLPGNKRYIVSHDVTVAEGVTLTFEAGSVIQFYENSQGYYDTLYNSPKIINYGTINLNGTADNMIEVGPSELFSNFACIVSGSTTSVFNDQYVNFVNITFESNISYDARYNHTKSYLRWTSSDIFQYTHGKRHAPSLYLQTNSVFEKCIINSGKANVYLYGSGSPEIQLNESLLICNSNYQAMRFSLRNSIISVEKGGSSRIELRGDIRNNVFLQIDNSNQAKDYASIKLDGTANCTGNKFYGMYQSHPETLIEGLIDSTGNYRIDVNDKTGQDLSLVWPYVTNIHMENEQGETINTCGTETVRFVVDFNRDMDTTKETKVFFGCREPYTDYEIKGAWVNARQWAGEYTLKANIENGQQRFRIQNAWTADAEPLECLNNGTMYTFNIDTTLAQSMSLQAVATEGKIDLTWMQDDYATLMGYNVYRSTSEDGNFVRINPTIINADENTFVDENAEPGVKYWYTFTVVLSDFTESNPAGKVSCTALDTILPNIYHTPVNQGYLNNNLVISCTARDNIAVETVMLYYRTVGDITWKSLAMSKQNDKYSATVFGSELTLAGLEYYIVATDSANSISKGSGATPYNVVIKDSSAISRLGDVDGDGVINTKDALMMMQAIDDIIILTDDQFKRADLNKDGVISSVEALRILQYINGKVTTLEM